MAIIGIIAAIAVPGLLRARMSGNEASAIGSLRAINSGAGDLLVELRAATATPSTLADLAKPAPRQQPGLHQPRPAERPSRKSGYTVSLAKDGTAGVVVQTLAAQTCNAAANDAASAYWAGAIPGDGRSDGQRSFATDTRGTIYFDNTGAAIANPIPGATSVLQ